MNDPLVELYLQKEREKRKRRATPSGQAHRRQPDPERARLASERRAARARELVDVARLTKYGVSREAFDVMVKEQGGVCALCGNPPDGYRLCIDHDHATGRVRALLCRSCNLTIGKTDDPEWFRRAARYLETHAPTP